MPGNKGNGKNSGRWGRALAAVCAIMVLLAQAVPAQELTAVFSGAGETAESSEAAAPLSGLTSPEEGNTRESAGSPSDTGVTLPEAGNTGASAAIESGADAGTAEPAAPEAGLPDDGEGQADSGSGLQEKENPEAAAGTDSQKEDDLQKENDLQGEEDLQKEEDPGAGNGKKTGKNDNNDSSPQKAAEKTGEEAGSSTAAKTVEEAGSSDMETTWEAVNGSDMEKTWEAVNGSDTEKTGEAPNGSEAAKTGEAAKRSDASKNGKEADSSTAVKTGKETGSSSEGKPAEKTGEEGKEDPPKQTEQSKQTEQPEQPESSEGESQEEPLRAKILYPDPGKNRMAEDKAYYGISFFEENQNPEVKIELSGTDEGSDRSEAFQYAVEKNEEKPAEADWKECGGQVTEIPLPAEDGDYRILVRGKDAAGEQVHVVECAPADGKEEEEVVLGEGEEMAPKYILVVDRTSPVASIRINPGAGTEEPGPKKNPVGNRYYFNTLHTAEITVEDRNFKIDSEENNSEENNSGENDSGEIDSRENAKLPAGWIRVCYAEREPEDYEDASKVSFAKGEFVHALEGHVDGQRAVFSHRAERDGVLQYLVQGEDLAGNPILYEDGDGTSDGGSAVEGGWIDDTVSWHGTDRQGPFVTWPLVTDRVIPPLQVEVRAGLGKAADRDDYTVAYRMTGDGAIQVSDPFQRADRAVVTAGFLPSGAAGTETTTKTEEDDAETAKAETTGAQEAGGTGSLEKTPYKIYFRVILRTDEEKEQSYASARWETGGSLEAEISPASGARVLRVEGFYAEDLAGNRVGSTAENLLKTQEIYLDPQAPEVLAGDSLAPAVTIVPAVETDPKYGVKGRPLFSSDVAFDVSVRDPCGPADPESEDPQQRRSRGSTGLRSIRYTLKNHREVIEEGTLFQSEYTGTGSMTNTLADESAGHESAGDRFTYAWKKAGAVLASAKKANFNSLVLTVTAVDNAGNRTAADYKFGIDATAPKLTLTYKNNTARNGFYFSGGRTAVIRVTERNFDPGSLQVAVTGQTFGSTVPGAGSFTQSEWVFQKGKAENGDGDTYTKTVTFDKDGAYSLRIFGAEGENVLVDHAGNKGSLQTGKSIAPFAFVIDRTKPTVSIRMEGGAADEDGEWYYRADNCGITVAFEDHGQEFGMKSDGDPGTCIYRVTIDGRTDGVQRELDLDSYSFAEVRADRKKYRRAQKITFTAKELAQGKDCLLRDGSHTVTVTAVDAAGNRADAKAFTANSRGCVFDGDGMSGRFVLDTVRPLVTKIGTVCAESTKGQDYPITDGQVYSDTGSIYYNKSIRLRIDVKDACAAPSLFQGSMYRDGDGNGNQPSVTAEISGTAGGISAVYLLTGDHSYRGLTLTGTDKAGNPLLLVDDSKDTRAYRRSAFPEEDSLVQSARDAETGKVCLKYGRTIDRTPPEAEIRYESRDYANLYREGKDKEKVRAYYNRPVDVKISFRDNNALDGSKLFAGEKISAQLSPLDAAPAGGSTGSNRTGNEENSFTFSAPAIRISSDSRRSFTAYGTDRALNPTLVSEMVPFTDTDHEKYVFVRKTAGAFNRKLTAQKAYVPKYQIIVDRTAPTFTLDVNSPGSANRKLQGGRYYFNSGFTAAFAIQETNYDPARITVRRASLTDNSLRYDSRTAKLPVRTSDPAVPVSSRDVRDTQSLDGVYRYAVCGSDKAGNALVPAASPGAGLEKTVGKNPEAGMETGVDTGLVDSERERALGSLEKEADLSVAIVVDRTAPKGSLEILAGSKEIYQMDTNGNVIYAEPYRKEETASVRIWVDEAAERSPVRIFYRIETTEGAGTGAAENTGTVSVVTAETGAVEKAGTNAAAKNRTPGAVSAGKSKTSAAGSRQVSAKTPFKYNNSVQAVQKGPGIFRVAEYTLTDLAGNARTYTMENRIYLDREAPAVDEIAPAIRIDAQAGAGAGGSRGGQPLFRSTVPLRIQVSDPDAGRSSSGLAEVSYRLYDAGKTSGSGVLHQAEKQKFNGKYRDPEPDFQAGGTVRVDSGRHNTNDIRIVVTARDNAGNQREAEYSFGIDVTKPVIRVSYDNNDAANGEYFREARTATVAVTERNFDPSKFQIRTESGASIGSWTHEGHGGSGDGDVWKAAVVFARDGNYTLQVSGEDLTGNPAEEIRFEGAAPRQFIIDRTAPDVSVTYDNNDVKNGKYFREARTASIRVRDTNFGGQNEILVESSRSKAGPGVRFDGETAVLRFDEDGAYSFHGTVTDKAGNVTALPEQPEFVIDTTPPVLRFEDGNPFAVKLAENERESDQPLPVQFFAGDVFAPFVTVLDNNCSTSPEDAVFKADGTKAGNRLSGRIMETEEPGNRFSGQIGEAGAADSRVLGRVAVAEEAGSLSPADDSFRISFRAEDFKAEKSRDDVYHVTAYAVDLAGNQSEVIEFEFSLNRFGSNFITADSDTEEYLRRQYYHNRTDKDLRIREYNTNRLRTGEERIELILNGNTAAVRELVRGEEYEVAEDVSAGSRKGGRIYLYTIRSAVFEREGDYSFFITSVDETGRTNTTSRIRTGSGDGSRGRSGDENSGSGAEVFPIEFVVDKTPPVNELSGVSSGDRQLFNREELRIGIHPEDSQTPVEQVVIRRWVCGTDLLGNPVTPPAGAPPVETRTYARYAEDGKAGPEKSVVKDAKAVKGKKAAEEEKPADSETEFYEDLAGYTDPETGKVSISYLLREKKDWQMLEIISTDAAGNRSVDIREGNPGELLESRREFLVTTDKGARLVRSKGIRMAVLTVLTLPAAFLLILLLLRRKKSSG